MSNMKTSHAIAVNKQVRRTLIEASENVRDMINHYADQTDINVCLEELEDMERSIAEAYVVSMEVEARLEIIRKGE